MSLPKRIGKKPCGYAFRVNAPPTSTFVFLLHDEGRFSCRFFSGQRGISRPRGHHRLCLYSPCARSGLRAGRRKGGNFSRPALESGGVFNCAVVRICLRRVPPRSGAAAVRAAVGAVDHIAKNYVQFRSNLHSLCPASSSPDATNCAWLNTLQRGQ